MSHSELYITWGLLFIIAMGISSVSRAVSRLHDEVEDFRKQLTGHGDHIFGSDSEL